MDTNMTDHEIQKLCNAVTMRTGKPLVDVSKCEDLREALIKADLEKLVDYPHYSFLSELFSVIRLLPDVKLELHHLKRYLSFKKPVQLIYIYIFRSCLEVTIKMRKDLLQKSLEEILDEDNCIICDKTYDGYQQDGSYSGLKIVPTNLPEEAKKTIILFFKNFVSR